MNGNKHLADYLVSGALKIQNGFPCGNWNNKGLGVLQLRPFNITEGGQINLSAQKFIETDRKLDNYLLKHGDVIFNNTNSEALVGKTAYWTRNERAALSNHMTILRVVESDMLNAQFLAFYLLFKWYQGFFESICQRHVNQASVGKDRLGALSLPLLELPEQKKIAHILSTVQRAIEQQERIIATTTELKKALMQKLFTEGLRGEPQKETEIGLVPKTWALIPVGELFDTQLGKMLSQKAKVGISPKPYLRNKNVQWGGIETDDLLSMDFNGREVAKFRLVKGDLLVCEGGEIGRAAIWNGELEECCYQKALHRLRPKDSRISNEFMVYWMMFSFLLNNTYGVTGTRTTIAHLPEIKLKPLLVPVPAAEEQQEIIKTLTISDQKIENHRRKLKANQDLFRTLLHELMAAKVRVTSLSFS